MQLAARVRRSVSSIVAALVLAACGGNAPPEGADEPASDGGLQGAACEFDRDCRPPDFICGLQGCERGCATAGCPLTKLCNAGTGRCDNRTAADGGTAGGG